MSAKQRADAESLKAKYARVYQLPIDQVKVELLEDEDAAVSYPGLPRWTLGKGAPSWTTNTNVRTYR